MAMATMDFRPSSKRWWQGRWASRLRDWLQRLILFPVLRLLCRPLLVEGIEHLAAVPGPVLLAANHSSHFDTLLVLRALPPEIRGRVTVAAAASLLVNAFPLQRSGNAHRSLGRCADLIQSGWSLLIYPEGTRSLDGTIQRFRGGVGLLATSLGVPVVPIHLEGAHSVMPKGRWWPRRAPVTVRIGEAAAYPPRSHPIAVASDLRSRVQALAASPPTGEEARAA